MSLSNKEKVLVALFSIIFISIVNLSISWDIYIKNKNKELSSDTLEINKTYISFCSYFIFFASLVCGGFLRQSDSNILLAIFIFFYIKYYVIYIWYAS